jgi:hypothetical protein
MFQQVIAIIRGVVVTSEATQAISILWMYMDYDPSSGHICWFFYNDTTKMLGPSIKNESCILFWEIIINPTLDKGLYK